MEKEMRMPYTEFKELLGAEKITFFPGKDGKRAYGMLHGECVIVIKEGLTPDDCKKNEDKLYVVKNPEKGYFLTISEGVEI